jgi:hypothetical protein
LATQVRTPADGKAAQPADPGARLLLQIGNFLEPLTRYDRSHLTMSESRHETVAVSVKQTFKVAYEVKTKEGAGGLPGGVLHVDTPAELEREMDARFRATKASAPQRLAAWAEAHGEDAFARPSLADCFTAASPVGYIEQCEACTGSGKVNCPICAGSGATTCTACKGRGASDCAVCETRGQLACQTCKGVGTILEQTQRKVYDDAIDQERVEHVQALVVCPVCNKTGSVVCKICEGKGETPCLTCEGAKTLPCKQCAGTGTQTCAACSGEGKRFRMMELVCTVNETFEAHPKSGEPEIAAALKARGRIEDVLKLVTEHHSVAEANSHTLTRDTQAEIPVTTISVAVAGKAPVTLRGFGPEQEVLDYRNIAGMLLVEDLIQLDGAIAMTRLVPPVVNDAIYDSLSDMLASEANFTIAMARETKTPAEAEKDFRGVVTAEYIKRASAAVCTGVTRAYWAGLANGPGWLLLLPLVDALLDLLLRGSGIGVRVLVLFFVMLATFGGGALAHVMVVRAMQARIAPTGTPKLSQLIDHLGLTRRWLIASAVTAGVLSLVVFGLTAWIFPSH